MAVAILLALGAAFFVMRGELRGQVGESLESVAARAEQDLLSVRAVTGAVAPFETELAPPPGSASGAVPLIRRRLAAPDQPLASKAATCRS